MQIAKLCPHCGSECAKADRIMIHFSCVDKGFNWHVVGCLRMRAHGIRAGVEPTSCYPGSSPSSPLAQPTWRDESRTEWKPSFFSRYIWAHPGKKAVQVDEKCRLVFPASLLWLNWGSHKTTGMWAAIYSLQTLFKWITLILAQSTKEHIFIARLL